MTNAVDFDPPTGSLHYGQPFKFDFQIRFSGDLVDADSNAATVTITDASGTEIVTAAATTRDDVGLYHYDFTVPAAGPAGIYLIQLDYLYSTTAQQTQHGFKVINKVVFDPSTITAVDVPTVRWICRDAPDAIIEDEFIGLYIFESNAYVNGTKHSSADATAVLLAKMFDASVAVFAGYISAIQENVAAITLEEAMEYLRILKARRERWMDIVTGMTTEDVSFTSIVPARSSGTISQIRFGQPNQ